MSKKNILTIIHGVIAFLIYIIISRIPAPLPVTPVGMNILGIIIGLIYGLITIDPVIPSIFAVILVGFSGYTGVIPAIMRASGNFVVLICLSLMMFSGILSHTGLARALAGRIVSMKIANGRPWVLTFLILLASLVTSMVLTSLPVVLIMWEIAIAIFEVVGFKKGEKWPNIIMVGIVFLSLAGMTTMPFNVGVAADFGILRALDPTQVVKPIPFLISSVLLAVATIVGYCAVIRFILKPDVSKLRDYKSVIEIKPFTTDQKRALVLLGLLIVMLILPDLLPESWLKGALSNLGPIGTPVLLVGVALCIRNKDGTSFITIKQAADAGIYWPMLIMIGSINVACGFLTDPQLGIADFMIQTLTPMVSGLHPFAFFVIFLGICYLLTNWLDGSVVAFVSIPVMYALTKNMSLTAVGIMASLTHNVQSGILLPSASPSAGLMYANTTGWTTRGDIFKHAFVYMILYGVLHILIGYAFVGMY
jgi:sodium-dependent dicarboxylate transporter 2/3/5